MDSIFTITKSLEELFLSLDDGEMTDEQVQEYENLGMALAEKQENTLKYARRLELDEEAVDSEINRLKALKMQINNKHTSIVRLIEYSMDQLELNELNFGSIRAVRRLNTPKTIIDESIQLPSKYTRKKITIVPNKDAIRHALKNGEQIEGCRLQQDTRIDII